MSWLGLLKMFSLFSSGSLPGFGSSEKLHGVGLRQDLDLIPQLGQVFPRTWLGVDWQASEYR